MIDFSTAQITSIHVHFVGNKDRYEGNVHQTSLPIDNLTEELIIGAFQKTFQKDPQFWGFRLDEEDENAAENIFTNATNGLIDYERVARDYASKLYDATTGKIQGSSVFFATIENLLVNGELVNGLGIWKTTPTAPYMAVTKEGIVTQYGFNPNSMECGAIILDTERADGHLVVAIDKMSAKKDRSFFIQEFLALEPKIDDFYQTRHRINITAKYITEVAPNVFKLDRPTVIDLLNKADSYFKDNEEFQLEDFCHKVLGDEKTESFIEYSLKYSGAYAIPIEDSFQVHPAAYKLHAKLLKAKLMLDGKNYALAINGPKDRVKTGFDEAEGKRFYTVFFDSEELK